ncbi:hypothetical protein BXZ70DRAFT_1077883 [Cristinia sonorae]|uniref:Uncharacterized protein n=1 Tax=Cristinia sonorae TaxID=1940300 RepID=A0A8K0UQC8_9AGAR|nr:hypothetical protein BXZ70DRAFT_1077883 [Cristinia sonorae]
MCPSLASYAVLRSRPEEHTCTEVKVMNGDTLRKATYSNAIVAHHPLDVIYHFMAFSTIPLDPDVLQLDFGIRLAIRVRRTCSPVLADYSNPAEPSPWMIRAFRRMFQLEFPYCKDSDAKRSSVIQVREWKIHSLPNRDLWTVSHNHETNLSRHLNSRRALSFQAPTETLVWCQLSTLDANASTLKVLSYWHLVCQGRLAAQMQFRRSETRQNHTVVPAWLGQGHQRLSFLSQPSGSHGITPLRPRKGTKSKVTELSAQSPLVQGLQIPRVGLFRSFAANIGTLPKIRKASSDGIRWKLGVDEKLGRSTQVRRGIVAFTATLSITQRTQSNIDPFLPDKRGHQGFDGLQPPSAYHCITPAQSRPALRTAPQSSFSNLIGTPLQSGRKHTRF